MHGYPTLILYLNLKNDSAKETHANLLKLMEYKFAVSKPSKQHARSVEGRCSPRKKPSSEDLVNAREATLKYRKFK